MERIVWIDIAKGIGIILVVLGHVNYVSDIDYNILRLVYMFHMPLFFFLSGYLYKKNTDIKGLVKNKFQQLMIPYFASLFVLAPFSSMFKELYASPDITFTMVAETIGKLLFGGCYLYDEIGPLWFLPVLFFTQIVYSILCNRLRIQDVHLVLLLLLMLAYILSMRYAKDQLVPFSAHVVMVSLSIYHIGHMYKKSAYKENIILVSLLSIISVISIWFYPDNIFSMFSGYYGFPFFTLFCAIVMILLIKNVSEAIAKNNRLARFFTSLGKDSLFIMCFHMFFMLNVVKYISVNPILVIVLTLIMTYLLALLFDKFALTRALFKGSRNDIQLIIKKIKK
ncbi:MAG: acyltransferase family protein [Dysgonomonas sp.]